MNPLLSILHGIRNIIVKIIPENSSIYRKFVLLGLLINARNRHKPIMPFSMGVFATRHCNLNCKCCTAFSPIAKEEFLDIESFKKDMERLALLTKNRLLFFYVTGGEPLLHPDIETIFDIARFHFPNTRIFFVTNGILLTKKPETFWSNLSKNRIEINISRYPIKLDMDQIKHKATDYGVIVDYVGSKNVPIKKMWKYPLCLEGKQPLKKSYKICSQINQCMTIQDGYVYPCNTIANIKHFNTYFKQNLKLSAEDVLDINKVKHQKEISRFLCTPKPFCRYCNRRGIQLGIPYESSKRDITEWT